MIRKAAQNVDLHRAPPMMMMPLMALVTAHQRSVQSRCRDVPDDLPSPRSRLSTNTDESAAMKDLHGRPLPPRPEPQHEHRRPAAPQRDRRLASLPELVKATVRTARFSSRCGSFGRLGGLLGRWRVPRRVWAAGGGKAHLVPDAAPSRRGRLHRRNPLLSIASRRLSRASCRVSRCTQIRARTSWLEVACARRLGKSV